MSEPSDSGQAVGRETLFAALRHLDQRCREHAVGLPLQEEPADVWAGVLYFVGRTSLLSSLADVEEVLNLPQGVTKVPATARWVYGIANNRGTLLPVFDLRSFLFGTPTSRSAKSRVMVVRQTGFSFGLLVGDVVGIRHMEASTRLPEAPDLGEGVDALLAGSFRLGVERKAVLDLQKLAMDARFNETVI